MGERAHGLFALRAVPALAGRGVRALATLVFTAAGLCWLDPGAAPLVACAALAAFALPLVFLRLLTERELLVRSHHGALSRFYFEALLGLVAVRVHGAERALRREHEELLVEWARAGTKLARGALGLRVVTSLAGAALAIALVAEHLARNGTTPAALLFGYWSLSLPALGEQLALVVLQAPAMRNATLRALEPLGAPVGAPAVRPAGRATPSRSPRPRSSPSRPPVRSAPYRRKCLRAPRRRADAPGSSSSSAARPSRSAAIPCCASSSSRSRRASTSRSSAARAPASRA
jgi:ATP-binding cassette subfamily B protein